MISRRPKNRSTVRLKVPANALRDEVVPGWEHRNRSSHLDFRRAAPKTADERSVTEFIYESGCSGCIDTAKSVTRSRGRTEAPRGSFSAPSLYSVSSV